MRRAVWYRSRASRPRHASSSENEYIPLLRGARRRRCLIDLCLLDFFLYLGGAAATGVARFPVSVTVLGLVGRPLGGDVGPRRMVFPRPSSMPSTMAVLPLAGRWRGRARRVQRQRAYGFIDC